MSLNAIARPLVVAAPRAAGPAPSSAPATATAAPSTPGRLTGLTPDAYAALARSYAQSGNQDLADQYTLAAVKAAKTGGDALAYATQRFGPNAGVTPYGGQWDEYRRVDAPYVASTDTQLAAVKQAAARIDDFDTAVAALRANPAQKPDANAVMVRRIADLAPDDERLGFVMPLLKDLGRPDSVAYAQAAEKAKPRVSWWTRLVRGLEESQF